MSDLLAPSISKNGLHAAVRTIAADALAAGQGGALPTNAHYQRSHGFTAGTLQRALNHLREHDALATTSRGALGRQVEWVNLAATWHEAALPPVRLLIPPSGLIETDVLAEMFAQTLTTNGIAHAIEHAHGGHNRLRAAATGTADLAVVSKATADAVVAAGLELTVPSRRRELDVNTFYAPTRVMVVRRAGDRETTPRRIGIDRNSADHVLLTEGEFPPEKHEYIDIQFPRTLAWVLTGRVDAAIWHVTTIDVPITLAGFALTPLRGSTPAAAGDDRSRAVIALSDARPELAAIVTALPLSQLGQRQRAAAQAEVDRHREFFEVSSEGAVLAKRGG